MVVIIVSGVTAFSSLGFTAVIGWYALERLAFARHYGSRLHELRRLRELFARVALFLKRIMHRSLGEFRAPYKAFELNLGTQHEAVALVDRKALSTSSTLIHNPLPTRG